MAQQDQFELSEEDFEAIVRTAATEVGHGGYIRSHPQVIGQMAEAVADTIINRTLASNYPNTVSEVANQRWQFSAINVPPGAVSHRVYGAWQDVPDSAVHPFMREHLTSYLQNRARGAPSRLEQLGVPGALNFANPSASSESNREGWIADMQRAGAVRLGIGSFEHYHGTDPAMASLGYSPQIRIDGIQRRPPGPNPASDFNQQELAHIAPPIPAMPADMARTRLPPNPIPRPDFRTPQAKRLSFGQPDPTNDFNQQELAAIASPNPVPRPDIRAPDLANSPLADANTPIADRTFSGYQESIFSPTHAQAGLENITPRTRDVLARISQTSGFDELGVNSGFRTPERNRAVRGVANSPHLGGHAVDIDVSGLNASERTRLLDSAIDAGARGVGVANSFLHIDTDPNKQGTRGTGFRTWGYDATGGDPAPWAYQSERYQDMLAGESPVELGYLGVTSPMSREAALARAPRREETTPRLSETFPGLASAPRRAAPQTFNARPSYPSGLPPARSTGVPANAPQSTFPARPSMGTGGLPAAPSSGLDTMRALHQQTLQSTQRPQSGPFPVSSPPASAPRRSPDQFQYQTRTRQVPNPAYRAPNAPGSPNQATPLTSYFSGMSGADYRSPAPAAPREPEFIPERYHVPVPGPVQGPQFGNVPNPMARPLGLPQTLGPVPRRRVGPVPSPIVPPNVPRRQGFRGQGFGGLGDWAQGFMAPRVADPVRHTMRQAPRVQQAGPPMQLTPPQMQPEQADQGAFLQSLLSTQPTNPSLNGRAQGPWNSTGGEGGFVW